MGGAIVRQWQSAVRGGLLEVGVLPYNGFTFDHIRTIVQGRIHSGEDNGSNFNGWVAATNHWSKDLKRCVRGMRTIENLSVQVPQHATLELLWSSSAETLWWSYGITTEDAKLEESLMLIIRLLASTLSALSINYSPGTNPQATVMMLGRYACTISISMWM